MIDEKFKRQIDLIDPDTISFNIHIIGVGGIGSWTALLAAKMGCTEIHVYDDDIVESHNTASQFFKVDQLGQKKVEAIKSNIEEQSGISIFTHEQKMEDKIEDGLVIIAVDSMEERIKLFKMFKDKKVYVIDARMGGLQMEIYRMPAKKWGDTLVDPSVVEPEPCTGRSICFNCAVIGGIITHYIRLFGKKEIQDGEMIFLFSNPLFLSQKKYDTGKNKE